MAEVEHALHRPGWHVFHHPLQILQLQVGNADVPDDAILAETHERRQRLDSDLFEAE